MSPFFVQALRRSGVWELPPNKAFLFGRQLSYASSDSADFRGLNPEDLEVRYRGSSIVPFGEFAFRKPLVRFDFTHEWNNLGYGAIRFGGIWGLAGRITLNQGEKVATIHDRETGEFVCDYVVRLEHDGRDTLWINRDVGLIDGYDWSVVEAFLEVPFVEEVPFGYDGAVTMRIDCDEAIETGRRLFKLYDSLDVPFSVAIKTQQSIGSADKNLISDLIAAGGSVVGHSHTHAPNWGGGGDATMREIEESRKILRETGVSGINEEYVVSPFHQNSVEAVQGLQKSGVKGFVSGIICNDPEFLMARSGQVPLVDGIISHSQQCMFHGDTVHADPTLSVYFRAFRQALETRTFFGFLDHPFSNYWYGWASEDERLDVHSRFLDVVTKTQGLWRANLVDAMKFLDMRSKVRIRREGSQWIATLPQVEGAERLPAVALKFQNRRVKLEAGNEVAL